MSAESFYEAAENLRKRYADLHEKVREWQKLIREVYGDDEGGPIGTNWREEFVNLADEILGFGKGEE